VAPVKTITKSTSTDQQLIDLRKALDAGAITKQQYDDEKDRIVRGN
jgi:hypothetical protein